MSMPNTGTGGYRCALFLRANGPIQREELLKMADLGASKMARESTISRALALGWFVMSTDGEVSLSGALRRELDRKLPPVQAQNSTSMTATSRATNAFERKTYKSQLNSRGTRTDIPDWSQRQPGFSFKSPFSTREA